MPRKGDGGLKNLPALPDSVNDVNFVSTPNLLCGSPGNNKVTGRMPGGATATKKAENK